MNRRDFLRTAGLGIGTFAAGQAFGQAPQSRPNVLWIFVEDASPHVGCYGEKAVSTPNIDALAAEGVRFENAFVTCPVCSPSRSAFVTGMYQTTMGSHNHRSQNKSSKAGGNTAYYESYELPDTIPTVSHLFREAGYYTSNGADPSCLKSGKTDYNFISTEPEYDGKDWRDAPEGTPFYAQIQLRGGKSRPKGHDAGDFELPPYYPDDPLIRQDWSEYLGSWEQVDDEVGAIVRDLKDRGVYDNTLIFFLTDHGVSHARGKQFLYEEGIRVPLIARFPGGARGGTVRGDMALHIDLAATSLAFAGIEIPENMQGLDLFAGNYSPRDYVFSGRDRCDETIDVIRCVRTQRYKYIRNFLSYLPHMQHNQYKDGKDIVQRLRELHKAGELTPLQDRIFEATRPQEELYDLEADPFETENLAESPEHGGMCKALRETLYDWMRATRDPGLVPEPLLEDLGKEHGSKHAAMKAIRIEDELPGVFDVIVAGEGGDTESLRNALKSESALGRYWAATWLGNNQSEMAREGLEALTGDPVPSVQIAAHLALCHLGSGDVHIPKLADFLDHKNLITGMYAMNAIEQTGKLNGDVARAAKRALENPYDGTQRYGRRLIAKCEGREA